MSDKQPLLSIRDLDRSFGEVRAVRSVSFDCRMIGGGVPMMHYEPNYLIG